MNAIVSMAQDTRSAKTTSEEAFRFVRQFRDSLGEHARVGVLGQLWLWANKMLEAPSPVATPPKLGQDWITKTTKADAPDEPAVLGAGAARDTEVELRAIVDGEIFGRVRRVLLDPAVSVDPNIAPVVADAQIVLRQIDAALRVAASESQEEGVNSVRALAPLPDAATPPEK